MASSYEQPNGLFLDAARHREAGKGLREAGVKALTPAQAALARAGKGAGARRRTGMQAVN